MLLSSIRRRYVGPGGYMGKLTDRLIRSKRMPKARKKLSYEGKNRECDYLNHHLSSASVSKVLM